jgi:hypothetical protein
MRQAHRKERTMTTEIEVQELINFETATDGTAVKLIVRDVANRKVGIIYRQSMQNRQTARSTDSCRKTVPWTPQLIIALPAVSA